jgi:hypothetical protein
MKLPSRQTLGLPCEQRHFAVCRMGRRPNGNTEHIPYILPSAERFCHATMSDLIAPPRASTMLQGSPTSLPTWPPVHLLVLPHTFTF